MTVFVDHTLTPDPCAVCGAEGLELDCVGYCLDDDACLERYYREMRSAGVKGDLTREQIAKAREDAGGNPTLKILLGEIIGGVPWE